MNLWNKAILLIASGLLIVGAHGCATVAGGAKPEDVVRQLAQARWDAQVAGDFEKVYSLTPPSYRAVVDYKRFRAKVGSAAAVTGAEVVRVVCDAGGCTSTTRLDFVHFLSVKDNQGSTHFDERWIQEDGRWWLYQR